MSTTTCEHREIATASRVRGQWPAAALAVVFFALAVTAGLRLRLANMPLERDEGEYAYCAQSLLRGAVPYEEAYTMKWPGMAAVYTVFLALRSAHPEVQIRAGLLVLNALTALGLGAALRRWLGSWRAAGAAVLYLAASLQSALHGFSANAEHVAVLFLVGALVAVPHRSRCGKDCHRRWFLAGICIGLAGITKQHALIAAPAFALAAWRGPARRQHVLLVAAGTVLSLMAMVLLLHAAGVGALFRLWTIRYARAYASALPLRTGLRQLQQNGGRVAATLWPLLLLAVLGGWTVFRKRRFAPHRRLLGAFILVSVAAVCPGLYFRPHYFLFLLPVLAVLGAVGLSAMYGVLPRRPTGRTRALVLGAVFLLLLLLDAPALLSCGDALSRRVYGSNPFPACRAAGRHLRAISDPEDRIGILGSEPQICVYAQRRKATPYLYMYPLMEDHDLASAMMQDFSERLRKARPPYLVAVAVPVSWHEGGTSAEAAVQGLWDWVEGAYSRTAWVLVGDGAVPQCSWRDDLPDTPPDGARWVGIYRRRPNTPR